MTLNSLGLLIRQDKSVSTNSSPFTPNWKKKEKLEGVHRRNWYPCIAIKGRIRPERANSEV